MTNVGEWDKFRNIDMDKEAGMIEALKSSPSKRRGRIGAERLAVLNAWHRVDCRTRDALRRSFLSELIESYEVIITKCKVQIFGTPIDVQIVTVYSFCCCR